MPIYEYRCTDCGHELEALQKLSDEPLKDCPECHTASLKKKVTAAAFRLKGGGWYETDFKSGDKKKNLAGEKPAKSAKNDAGGAESGAAKKQKKGDSASSSKP